MRSLLLVLVVCAAAVGRAAAGPAPAAAPARGQAQAQAQAQSGEIAVDMAGFRNDKGVAAVALFTSSAGFPDHPERAARRLESVIKAGKARAVFRGLPAGTYAVAVLHDEDRDHRMKTGVFGIPREGYGASRDARGRFGPPKFDSARLALRAGQALRAPIQITYP